LPAIIVVAPKVFFAFQVNILSQLVAIGTIKVINVFIVSKKNNIGKV
jgi:hypothetical protein